MVVTVLSFDWVWEYKKLNPVGKLWLTPTDKNLEYATTYSDIQTKFKGLKVWFSYIFGCSQAVRHRTLTPRCDGSNPSTQAIWGCSLLVRQRTFNPCPYWTKVVRFHSPPPLHNFNICSGDGIRHTYRT